MDHLLHELPCALPCKKSRVLCFISPWQQMATVATLMIKTTKLSRQPPAQSCPLHKSRWAHSQGTGGSPLPPTVGTLVFILRRECDDPASLGCDSVAQGGSAGTYLFHQLGEVCAVGGRQPEQGARAGAQRRSVAHDQDDACCRMSNSSRFKRAQRAPFIRRGVPNVLAVKLPHVAPTP